MYVVPHRLGGLGLRWITLGVIFAASTSAQAKELKFEQVFNTKAEPISLHYEAQVLTKNTEHTLQVWRDADRRLKRRTDDSLEVYVFRQPGDAEFQMSVLDLKKRIHTRIDRTNLYRIGNFTDWFDLAHGLKFPKGDYKLSMVDAPTGVPKPVRACRWYDMTQQSTVTHICWDTQTRLPMIIQDTQGRIVWRILSVDRLPLAATTFQIHDEGFVRNDANKDIEND